MAISIQLIALLVVTTVIMLHASDLTIWKIVFLALLFIPSSAQGLISGTSYSTAGVLNLSMVCYISIIACSIVLERYRRLSRKKATYIFICIIVIILMRVIADGSDFISNKLLDNYLIPMVVAVVILSNFKQEYIPSILRFAYSCIFLGAIVACIEYIYGSSLLFHEYYMETCPWYENIYRSAQYVSFRSTSFFGHPLTGGLYYSIGIVYLLNSKAKKKNLISWIFQISVLFAALLSTNSRSALLGIAIYIVYYLFKNKKIGKIFAFSLIAIVSTILIDWDDLYYTFFARDITRSSFMVRIRALASIINIPMQIVLLGEGYNNTTSLLSTLGFTGNVEISYLIILLENGIIGFVAWISSLIVLYEKNTIKGVYGELNVSDTVKGMLFCVLFIGGMSNSFGDPGTLNYLIYILLSFISVLGKRQNTLEELNTLSLRTYKRRVRFSFRRY